MSEQLAKVWLSPGNRILDFTSHACHDIAKHGKRMMFSYEYITPCDVTLVYLFPNWLDHWDEDNHDFVKIFCDDSWFFETFRPLHPRKYFMGRIEDKRFYTRHFSVGPAFATKTYLRGNCRIAEN